MTHDEARMRHKVAAIAVRDGEDVPSVARRLRVSVQTVRNACVKYGVKHQGMGRVVEQGLYAAPFGILARLQEYKSLGEIAKEMNRSRQFVCAVKRAAIDAGIDLHRP